MQSSAHKTRLVVFVVRHIIGVALFAWLVWQSFRAGENTFGWILAALGAGYGAFAIWSGVRLSKLPQRPDARRK